MVVTGIFVVLILVGVGVFALFGGLSGNSSVGTVVIWGTEDSQTMENLLAVIRQTDKDFSAVTYVAKDPSTYESELINAIAAGRGPDLFMMNTSELGTFADKVLTVPYSAVSQSTYINSYIDEAQLFLNGQGAWALPFMVDPLVMYWNRDILATAGVGQPPQYWADFLTIAPKITSLDASQNVQQSAVALGSWDNVAHAKEILSTLFIQAGDPIVARNDQGVFTSMLGTKPTNATEAPAESALRFYTEFANPSKTTYSWNRSLPDSTEAFAAGNLGIYFGLASEESAIAARNPNLRFAVALMPQLQGQNRATFGVLTGLAVPRTSTNPRGALTIAEKLTNQANVGLLVSTIGLPPVRRDVAVDSSNNAAMGVFVQSALISHSWFDPNHTATDSIFKGMIESVTSGKSDPAQAVSDASQQFVGLFQQ